MKQITYKDMTISADIWKGTFDVKCRQFEREGLHPTELAELIYPAVDAVAKAAQMLGSTTPAPEEKA